MPLSQTAGQEKPPKYRFRGLVVRSHEATKPTKTTSLMILSVLLPLLLSVLLCSCWWCSRKSGQLPPPGPRPLPLIGHLHLLAKGPAPHILFTSLARQYGPIISLRFGSVPVVLASSAEAAKEFTKTHDAVFASRPPTAAGRIMFENYQDMSTTPYGERWRQLRRICTMELFTPRIIQSFQEIRMEEVRSLLEYITSSSASGATPVDLRLALTTFNFNHICKVLMGKRYYGDTLEDKSEATLFIHLLDKLFEALGQFAVGDFLPWLRWMDIGKVEARLEYVCSATNALIGRIIREHELKLQNSETAQEQVEDFIHVLLKLRDQGGEVLQGRTIKALLLDLFAGGSDTSSVTLEWTLAELIKHPSEMATLQEEIGKVVGLNRLVEESDVGKLDYLQAVLKETFRLHPPAPLLFPHFSTKYCSVMGYDIPKETMLILNIYSIGRDPALWKEPLEFKPERFLGSQMSFSGQHFELLPFGAGRRTCPGLSMAVPLLHLALANLVHAFDWKMPQGEQVDTQNESFGATVLMANKLQAIPVPRLPKVLFVA